VRKSTPSEEYRLAATFPTKSRSRWLATGVFGRLPWHNPGFVAAVGTLHLLTMLAFAGAAQQAPGAEQRLFTIPVILMAVVVLGSTIAFAMPPAAGHRGIRHWTLGILHGAVHIGIGVLGAWVWLSSPFHRLAWPLPLVVAALLYLPAIGLLASWLVAAYLLVAAAFQVNVNELFAAQGIVDYKSFLRLRIGADGALTIYPIAVERVSRRWRAAPDAPPDKPWIEPVYPFAYQLAEEPIRVR
jgi:hypothetical protein